VDGPTSNRLSSNTYINATKGVGSTTTRPATKPRKRQSSCPEERSFLPNPDHRIQRPHNLLAASSNERQKTQTTWRFGTAVFVTRSLAEQENLEFYRTMNTLTENPTSADIERTIPGTPKIPDNFDALITLLILNQIVLFQVIGDKAPPATEIQRLIEALYDNYNRLTGTTNF
jgi:hypothetical protein